MKTKLTKSGLPSIHKRKLKTKNVSRQLAFMRKRREQGICLLCANKAAEGNQLCEGHRQKRREYYQAKQDEKIAYGKAYYAKHRSRYAKYQKAWLAKNPTYMRDWYQRRKLATMRQVEHGAALCAA